jgi:hypothetical protein
VVQIIAVAYDVVALFDSLQFCSIHGLTKLLILFENTAILTEKRCGGL